MKAAPQIPKSRALAALPGTRLGRHRVHAGDDDRTNLVTQMFAGFSR